MLGSTIEHVAEILIKLLVFYQTTNKELVLKRIQTIRTALARVEGEIRRYDSASID